MNNYEVVVGLEFTARYIHNQKEFSIKGHSPLHSREDGEITILNEKFKDNEISINTISHGILNCKVVACSLLVKNDRMSIFVSVNIPVHSPTYDTAIEDVVRIMELDNVKIDEIMYLDETDGNVYTYDVDLVDVEVSEYVELVG